MLISIDMQVIRANHFAKLFYSRAIKRSRKSYVFATVQTNLSLISADSNDARLLKTSLAREMSKI